MFLRCLILPGIFILYSNIFELNKTIMKTTTSRLVKAQNKAALIPVLFIFLMMWCTPLLSAKGVVNERPNVIFFALDDLNDWINPLGYSQAKTPNMDRIAKKGVVFTNAHAPGSYCAPSRSAIWTGLQSSTTGIYQTELYQYDYPDLVPLQMAFKQAGYNAYGAGKLFHHGNGYVDLRGWDEYFARNQKVREEGYNMGYHGDDLPLPDPYPYSSYYRKTDNPAKTSGFMEWGPIPDERENEMLEVKRTNFACEVLQRKHEKPFFLALGLYCPHFPNYAPQKYFDMYNVNEIKVPELLENDWDDLPPIQRKQMLGRYNLYQKTLEDIGAVQEAVMAYLAAVSYADGMLGRVLDALEASEYNNNTVVVLWSDQGYHHGEKGQWGKHTLWKQTSHVPLIFAGNNIPQGETVDATVGLIDLYPTLIELCDLPKHHKMDGVSLVSSIMKPSSAKDKDLLVPYHERGSYAVINSNWRYIYYKEGTEELYNLKEDPNEWYNLAEKEENKGIKESMQKSAPKVFREPATSPSKLKLVLEGETFHWESKHGSSPLLKW